MATERRKRDRRDMETRRRLDGGRGTILCDAPPERRKTPALYQRTGLASRPLFRDRTEHALRRVVRVETRVAVVVLEMAPESAPLAKNRAAARALLGSLRSYDTAAELEDNYIGVLLEDVPNASVAQAVRKRLEEALPGCQASSVAVSDSRGRIGYWMGAANN